MAFDDTSSTANAVFSLRLGHGTALALSTQFTTVPPLRYPKGKGEKLILKVLCRAFFQESDKFVILTTKEENYEMLDFSGRVCDPPISFD